MILIYTDSNIFGICITRNKSDKDLPFNEHKQCDPAVWQFPQDLIETIIEIFEELGNEILARKNSIRSWLWHSMFI